MNGKMLYKYTNLIEAETIKVKLEGMGIRTEVRSFENWGYDGVFRATQGMGEIRVSKKDYDKAKEILDKYFISLKNEDIGDEISLLKEKRELEGLKATPFAIIPAIFFLILSIIFFIKYDELVVKISVGLFLLVCSIFFSYLCISGVLRYKKYISKQEKYK